MADNVINNEQRSNPLLTPHSRINVNEASRIFNFPKWKLWRAIRKGLIPHQRLLNGRIYLTVADIEAALATSSVNGGNHE